MTPKEKLEYDLKLVGDQIRRMKAGEWPIGDTLPDETLMPPNIEEMQERERSMAEELERITARKLASMD